MTRPMTCLVVALALCLAPNAGAAPSAQDVELARKVRLAMVSGLSSRLVSTESLEARVRGRSDLHVAREVNTRLLAVLGPRMQALFVSCDDGDVVLRGRTRDAATARQAQELAAEVSGVASVRSTLDGTPGSVRVLPVEDPSEPFSFATDRLLGGEDMQVRVERGVVHLTGLVNGPAARKFAVAAARSVTGVRSVVDELGMHEMSIGQDISTVALLRYRLEIEPDTRAVADDIKITVRSGVVGLTGEVADDLQRDRVETLVLSMRAVLVVSSNLELADASRFRVVSEVVRVVHGME